LLLCLAACQTTPAEETTPELTAAPPTATTAPTATATLPPTATATEMPTATATAASTETPAPTETAAPPTLIYLNGHGGAGHLNWTRDMLSEYMALHAGLVIDHVASNYYSRPVPIGYYNRLDNSSTPPDVGSGFIVGQMRQYVAAGRIADISQLWVANGWAEMYPGALADLATIDGKQYFVPQAIQWNPVFYRTDLFAAQGLTPPQTWDELLAACDTLAAADILPLAVSSSGWIAPLARYFTIINMRLNGPEFHEQLMAGQVSYQDERVRAVFVQWAELFAHNCFDTRPRGYNEAANMLFNGDAAMYFLGEWLSESYTNGFPETYDFFSFPIINPAVPRGEIAHIYGAYMLADTPNQALAEEFLTYLGSPDGQTSNVLGTGRLVANNQADISSLSDLYARGYQFVVEAPHLTQLFEFNTDPQVADVGLAVFDDFFSDQENLDWYLERLERIRQTVYGDIDS
ncbi:MAG: extracellular solute-binding protein, partial [Anaerolineales bacterium]|nr:extracellular solute-binding protein [Anaerolineales bacterium]